MSFLEEVEDHSGVQVRDCFQCGKCSGDCPTGFAMDYLPNQMMRLVQLGREEEALGSSMIWICDSCETCTTRCPKEVDVANVIDTLRMLSPQKSGPTAVFHKTFLSGIKWFGRVNEAGLMARYNLLMRNPFKDFGLALKLFRKRKLRLLPERAKGMRRLFREKQGMKRDA